jgi:4-amino-4-deoxy-L-arabinose transferase-like glycosyltransferase
MVTYLLPVLVGLVAFACRALAVQRSFELWVDEMVYTDLGDAVSRGQLPNLSGEPFFLHPPGAFLLEGLFIKIFGLHGDVMAQTLDLRWLNAGLGALTVVTGFLLVRATAGLRLSILCAALLAFDPFILRNNGHVFLETPAVFAVLLGFLIIVTGLATHGTGRLGIGRAITAGVLLGYGVLTKDALIMFAIVPIVVAAFWKRTIHSRDTVTILVSAAVPYSAYLIVVTAEGLFGTWGSSKISGIRRMVGLQQTTGFNAPNAPGLWGRLIDQTQHFGTSYVLLLVCPIAGLIAVTSANPARRLVGLAAVSMGFFGIYAALFGTLEEQYGYGVMIAGIGALVAATAELASRRPRLGRSVLVTCVVITIATVGLGIRAVAVPDNGFQRVREWVTANLPQTARVGVTNSTGQWAFRGDDRFGVWPSARAMLNHDCQYILTQSLPTSQGYGYVKNSMLEWLQAHARPVFTFEGLTNGHTVIWYVPQPDLQLAAQQGVGYR